MAEIDHLVYVVPDLDAAVDRVEQELGVRPEAGGRHEGLGTWNALLALSTAAGAPCYLELIAADPDQSAPPAPRPFGIDADAGPRLATFAVRPSGGQTIDDLVGILRARGHDPGEPVAASRRTPTGDELRWRLTFPTGAADGLVPFLIDWGDTPNPGTTIASSADLIEVSASAPDKIRSMYTALDIAAAVGDGTGALSAVLAAGGHRLRL